MPRSWFDFTLWVVGYVVHTLSQIHVEDITLVCTFVLLACPRGPFWVKPARKYLAFKTPTHRPFYDVVIKRSINFYARSDLMQWSTQLYVQSGMLYKSGWTALRTYPIIRGFFRPVMSDRSITFTGPFQQRTNRKHNKRTLAWLCLFLAFVAISLSGPTWN